MSEDKEFFEYIRKNRRRSLWQKFVRAMACIVVFCTTYALILPGITMESEIWCGYEEHIHEELCFKQLDTATDAQLTCELGDFGVHVHTDDCRDASGVLVCGFADYVIHTHNDFCYDASGNQICTLREVIAHIHSDACYRIPESETHSHSEACYEVTRGEQICTLEEKTGHAHDKACYGAEGTLICGQEEHAAYSHSEACYTVETVTTCGLETHPHTDACFTPKTLSCTEEEHSHGDSCYGKPVLICEAGEHTHGEGCYTDGELSCGEESHTHGSGCYAEAELVCGKSVHAHGDGCYTAPVQICGMESHPHTDACYTEIKTLVCERTETEGHTHCDSCYEYPLICTLTVEEGHQHSDDCFERIETLICGEDSTTAATEALEPVLSCGMDEIDVHTHSESCLDESGNWACGLLEIQEHTHTEACVAEAQEQPLTCTLEESEEHQHNELCYGTWGYDCGMEEHSHTLACFSNPEADVETAEVWNQMLAGVELTGSFADDLAAIAKTQLGYTESGKNYQVLEDGETMKGYTRYGAWAGDPYGDWSTYFVRFCLHCAEVPVADFPSHNDASNWIEKLNDACLYVSEADFVPMAGDVIFLEHEGTTLTGIVTKADEEFVTAIMGDYDNQVRSEALQLADSDILGYGMMPSQEMEIAAFASASNNPVVLAELNDYTDLTIKSVTYETDDMTNIGAEYLPDKDAFAIEFNMNFDLTKEQIIAAGGKYTYLLPSTVTVPQELLNNTYVGKDKTGSDAFNYRFVRDPDTGRFRIYVDFLQEYVDKLAEGKTVEAYINFGGEADGSTVQDDGSIKIEFHDPCVIVIPQDKIEYPENETHDYSIQTNKWLDGNYDKTNKTQKYKVEIVSRKGTPSEIDFTDTLTGLGITGISIDSIVKVTYTKQDGWDQEGTPETISPNSQNVTPPSITMKLPGLVTTDTTYQKYVITYTVTTDEVAGGQAATLTNTAKASATTPGGGEIKSSATTTTTISNKVLNKSGKYNTETKQVEWTITVNDTNSDIAGYWLTDSVFAGKTVGQLTAVLKIEPASGYQITEKNGQPVIQFDQLDGEAPNTNKYTITYMVDQAQSTLPGMVTNDAALYKENEGVDNSSSTVTIPAAGSIEKSLVSADEEKNSLTWSMTVNVPDGGLAAGTYIKDVTTNQSYTLAQMTQIKDQLDTILGNGKYSLQVSTDGWNFKDFDGNTLDSGVKSFRIKINENITPQSNPFTLTYSTTANLTTGYTYSNEAGMGSESNYPIWDKEEIVFRHTVEKLDRNFSANDLTYVTTEDGTIGWIVKVYIDKDCSTLTITDTLPDGVLLKRIGCTKDDWVVGTWVNGTAIDNPESVTIGNTTCVVSMLQADQMVTSTITAPEGNVIPGGNFVYVYYECRITDFATGENEKLQFTNRVNVDMDNTQYGEDDQTQEVTFPDPITKMDSNGNANDSSMSYNNGYIGWFVKVFINKDTQSFAVEDQLPKGVTLKKLGANTARDAAKTGAVDVTASSFKLTSNLPGSNATSFVAATETTGPKVTATFTADGTAVFSAGTTLYLYYECEIDSLDAGSTASFKNDAKLTIDNTPFEDSQTQTVTRPVRTEKLAANEHHQPVNEYKVTNSDGIIGWFVRVNLEEKPNTVFVEDKLPEGVTLTKIGFAWAKNDASYNAWQYSQQVGESKTGELTYGSHTARYSIEDDGKTIKTDIVSSTPEEAPSILYMYYECRINGIPAPGDADQTFTVEEGLTNEATVKVNNADPGDSVTNKQKVEINIPKAVYNRVDKSGSWMEGQNRINYQILLNEGAEQLALDGQELVLTDKMTYSYSKDGWPFDTSLVASSVTLHYAVKQVDAQGNVTYVKGNPVPDASWRWQFSSNLNDAHTNGSGNVENVLTVTIPDKTALIFSYAYDTFLPKSYAANNNYITAPLNNTATLNCSGKNSDTENRNENWKWSNTSGGVNSEGSFLFTKVETGNYGHALPGAVFTVFTADGNPLKFHNQDVTYTTNENGTFVITKEDGQAKDEEGNVTRYYQENVVYYVQETTPPDGYWLPANAPKYYFYFYNPQTVSEGQISVPEGVTVHDLNTVSDAVYVENEKNSVDIPVTKAWDVPEGTELPESITVKLMLNGELTDQTLTLSAENEWKGTFFNLPKYDADGKPYAYSVVETPVEGYSISYNQNTDGSWMITNTRVKTTSITVEKQWYKDGEVDSTNVTPVSFELWQVGSYEPPATSSGSTEIASVDMTIKIGGYAADGAIINTTETVKAGSTLVVDYYTTSMNSGLYIDGCEETGWQSISLTGMLISEETTKDEWNYEATKYHYRYTYLITGKIPTLSISGYIGMGQTSGYTATYSVSESADSGSTWTEPTGDVVRKYDTYAVINHDGTLKKEISGLPVTGVDANGATLYYTYYVKEVNTSNWIGYENNNGITEGTILMKNEVPDETPSYELPSTGSIGTMPYTLGGLAMLLCGAVLFLLKRRQIL